MQNSYKRDLLKEQGREEKRRQKQRDRLLQDQNYAETNSDNDDPLEPFPTGPETTGSGEPGERTDVDDLLRFEPKPTGRSTSIGGDPSKEPSEGR